MSKQEHQSSPKEEHLSNYIAEEALDLDSLCCSGLYMSLRSFLDGRSKVSSCLLLGTARHMVDKDLKSSDKVQEFIRFYN